MKRLEMILRRGRCVATGCVAALAFVFFMGIACNAALVFAQQTMPWEIPALVEEETHASEHAVGGEDTVFPADPNADRILFWNDGAGALGWLDYSGWDMDASDDFTTADETDPAVGAVTGIVLSDGAGGFSAAVAGTDYQAPLTDPIDDRASPDTIGGVSPGRGIFAPSVAIPPTPVSSGFAGTVSSSGSTITFTEAADDAVMEAGSMMVAGGVTVYVLYDSGELTWTVLGEPALGAGTAITSITGPAMVKKTAAGLNSWLHFSDGTAVQLSPGTGTVMLEIGPNGSISAADSDFGAVELSGNLSITKADPSIVFTPATAGDTRFWLGTQDDADGVDDDYFQIGYGATPGTTSKFSMDKDGAVTATSFMASAVATPSVDFYDSDCTDDDVNASIDANATATGTGAEVVDVSFKAQGAAVAGTLGEFLGWDGSEKTLVLSGVTKVSSQAVTCASNVCAYSAAHSSSYYTTEANAAADVVTVADAVAGVRRTFVLKTDGGDDLEVTPTNFANGTKVTLDTAGESVTLEFDGTKWFIVSTYGGVAS
jgi:hypothetical protein